MDSVCFVGDFLINSFWWFEKVFDELTEEYVDRLMVAVRGTAEGNADDN